VSSHKKNEESIEGQVFLENSIEISNIIRGFRNMSNMRTFKSIKRMKLTRREEEEGYK
jgi:hypothetical protein